jgi:hypothetical protein
MEETAAPDPDEAEDRREESDAPEEERDESVALEKERDEREVRVDGDERNVPDSDEKMQR